MNSCNSALIMRIEEKYKTLDELEQFRITYLDISFDKMFNRSKVFTISLHNFINNFNKDGIFNIPNVKFLDMTQQMNALCERLAEAKELPHKTPVHVLT